MKEESLGFARLGMLWEPRCTASGGMMATASASNPRLRDCDREAPGGVQGGRSSVGDLSDGMTEVDSPSRTWDREQHDWEMEFGVLCVQSV